MNYKIYAWWVVTLLAGFGMGLCSSTLGYLFIPVAWFALYRLETL